ncbi:oxidoreductase [Naematelia encephala]|uniref:Oxidoreductase n=1 Tax=Naematelia encephala TaxID=71784 RepID=A0A1Y2ATD4_9TREE|nr:oxidoreductase [Naematelia encephala]
MSAVSRTEFPGVALITGAGGTGIGSAVAHAFVREGCRKVILTDVNPTTLESTCTSLKALAEHSGKEEKIAILVVSGDISDSTFVDHLFSRIKEDFGRLDYAVNCAGIIGNNLPSSESAVEDFDRINGVNYKGLWLCSRKELELMKGQEIRERAEYGGVRIQRGSIVNIASQLGIVGRPNAPIYCASKSAVIGLTRCDAIDYSPHLIRVNAVCPGIIDTPMVNNRPTGAPAMDISKSIAIAPMNRVGKPEEVADVCLFLCSEKASFVQGAAWLVDGGYTIN